MALPVKFEDIRIVGGGMEGSAKQYLDPQYPDTEDCVVINKQVIDIQKDIDAAYLRKKNHFPEGSDYGSQLRDAFIKYAKKLLTKKQANKLLLGCPANASVPSVTDTAPGTQGTTPSTPDKTDEPETIIITDPTTGEEVEVDAVTGQPVGKKNNMMLYLGIGASVVLIVGILIFKNKKSGSSKE